MRIILLFISIFVFKYSFATEVSIIELHETKSLDQLVLESNQDNIQNAENESEVIEEKKDDENIDSNEENVIENDVVNISNFLEGLDPLKIDFYFSKIISINSSPLYNEFVKILTDLSLDTNSQKNNEIIYMFTKKLVELGEIQKAYNLINSINLENDKNLAFYKTIELNYLFSTYQLSEACELKNEFILNKLELPNFYLEKIDIFCLVMQEKFDEANLLNSILIETQNNNDQYFQELLNVLLDYKNKKENEIKLPNNYNNDLIFLYSAMLRIAELPLNEEFFRNDPNNLAIPIILSSSTNISLRLKAANKAYLSELISIESLSALYQSVDFNSEQLNNPNKTIAELNDKNELIMAYYFQLANIQIFPSSRLNVIIDFWKFAENIGFQSIAYNLSYNIISSIEPNIDNIKFGSFVATSLINNNDYEKAYKWILFIENSNVSDDDLEKVKLLYDVYQSEDIANILNYIENNFDKIINNQAISIKEILYVTLKVLGKENIYSSLNFEQVMDSRTIPTIFLSSQIEDAIQNKKEFDLIMLLLISINGKEWTEIHPDHLQLFLEGIKNYKNSELLKTTLLDIFENYNIF